MGHGEYEPDVRCFVDVGRSRQKKKKWLFEAGHVTGVSTPLRIYTSNVKSTSSSSPPPASRERRGERERERERRAKDMPEDKHYRNPPVAAVKLFSRGMRQEPIEYGQLPPVGEHYRRPLIPTSLHPMLLASGFICYPGPC